MKSSVTIQKAISFTKLSVALVCSWPPPPTASKLQVLVFEGLWCMSVLNSVLLLLPLLDAVYEYRGDPIILGKTVSLFCGVVQATIKMLLCRVQRDTFRDLNYQMESFCKHANVTERDVLQRYVERYKYGHAIYTFWCYFTTLLVISAPLYFQQQFPTHAKYRFSTEQQPLKTLIYLHQSLVGFQASAGMTMDCQIALLLWYVVARFELLSMELRNVTSGRELDTCIRKHKDILRYTENVSNCVRFLILTTVATTTVGVIFGSLNLVTNQPVLVKAVFLVVVFSGIVELFMCAWPADNLLKMSEDVALNAYSSRWFESDVKIQKKILQIIMRSQRPATIQISGFFPQLSLHYYASYLYTSFSYFTALRVLVGTNDLS